MNNQIGERMVFANAVEALMKAGFTGDQIKNAILSQSYLRLEVLLNATASNYNFPILVNEQGASGQAKRATEQRLNLQDAFYASNIAFYIFKATGATDTAVALQTYPNSVTFTQATPMETLYNGQLQLTVNGRQIVPAYDLMRFRNIPQTQLTAATNSPVTEFHGIDTCVIEPNLVFNGQKQNKVQIQLPSNISAIDSNVYGCFIFRGVLAQNVTVVS